MVDDRVRLRSGEEGDRMNERALWRRLDRPGHDAAALTSDVAGRSLCGVAVFLHEAGPARVDYSVDLDPSWRTLRGRVNGFVGDRTFDHIISRGPEGWRLNGTLIAGLDQLDDLDFGFTPATNMQQLQRAKPAIGQTIDLAVAWFDVDAVTLTKLPQRYQRRSETTYSYEAPTIPYEGLLELTSNGFVANYPGLWILEKSVSAPRAIVKGPIPHRAT